MCVHGAQVGVARLDNHITPRTHDNAFLGRVGGGTTSGWGRVGGDWVLLSQQVSERGKLGEEGGGGLLPQVLRGIRGLGRAGISNVIHIAGEI